MAKTQRDIELRARIERIIKQLGDKPHKEMIECIAGICGIGHRTASEHYRAFKAQKNLKELGFNETCEHDWSNAFATPGGLCRECKLCGKTKFANLK